MKTNCVVCGNTIEDNVCEPCERAERLTWTKYRIRYREPGGTKTLTTEIHSPKPRKSMFRAIIADAGGFVDSGRFHIRDWEVI